MQRLVSGRPALLSQLHGILRGPDAERTTDNRATNRVGVRAGIAADAGAGML
jgi:hypothetical protein